MSDTKQLKGHTLGPWIFQNWVKAYGQGNLPTEIMGVGEPYGRKIAELNFDIHDAELSSEKVIANAKLIASAPELLEALRACEITLKAFLPDAFATISIVDAAIKKATE